MGRAWIPYSTLAGGEASTVPSGLEPLLTSILYWALSGVHELAEDGCLFPLPCGFSEFIPRDIESRSLLRVP